MPLTPSQRVLRAKLGGLSCAANHDGVANTAKARKTFRESFAAKVRDEHPDLGEAEVERRAKAARRAFYSRLAFQSAVTRARRRKSRPAGAVSPQGVPGASDKSAGPTSAEAPAEPESR
jgi:hypothetical protein